MTSKPKSGRRVRVACAVLTLAVLTGCASRANLELRSYKSPGTPEQMSLRFDRCAFSRDRNGDYHISADIGPGKLGDHADVQQRLYAHVFWRPLPGRTFDDPSGCDATLVYVVETPHGTTVYEGSGFVYAKPPKNGDLQASLEQSKLRPTRSSKDAADVLGELSLTGTLSARRDAILATEMRGEIERRTGRTRPLAGGSRR